MSEKIGGEEVPDSTRDLEVDGEVDIMVEDLDLWYGDKQALYGVSLPIAKNSVTALIGPSGCGKSTLLRMMNRMNDLIPICHYDGKISMGEVEITAKDADLVEIRKNIGMVFQRPNPFPKSIYDNVGYGVGCTPNHHVKRWMQLLKRAPSVQRFGMRYQTECTTWEHPFQADNSKDCASLERLQ